MDLLSLRFYSSSISVSRKRSRTFRARISVFSPLYGQYRSCFPANLPALPFPQSAAFSHCGLLSACRGIQNRLCTAAAALYPLISDVFPIDGIHFRTAYPSSFRLKRFIRQEYKSYPFPFCRTDGTGFRFFSQNPDSTALQDLRPQELHPSFRQ